MDDERRAQLRQILRRVAEAMWMDVEYARFLFDSVGPINALEIVSARLGDPQAERIVAQATDSGVDWWWV